MKTMEKKEKINRKTRAIETKNKIRKCADQMFREYGIENVSVDSIVEMAGVSKGAFYVHFDSKDSLTADLINDFVKEVDLDYKSYIDSFPADTRASDILISMIGKIADTITYTIGYSHMKTIYKMQITKTVNTDAVLSYNRELYKMFTDIISRGVEQGDFRAELPVDTLVKHCILAYRGLTYEWCIRYPDFDLKEQALNHFKILLIGVKNH
jgi:AcrR family transcriptional regulator